MKYFVDTEFVFHTLNSRTEIQPISIGIVAEDGRELYLCDYGFDFPKKVRDRLWIAKNVVTVLEVNHLVGRMPAPSVWHREITEFVGSDVPEFWGDYSSFDYVVLSTIMGGFEQWPDGWPMHINDFQQIGVSTLPSAVPHNALADARALYETWKQIEVPS